MPRINCLRAVPSRILSLAKYVEPPGKLPRGYFEQLMEPTKTLLSRGLKLHAAADWLIDRGVLPCRRRQKYLDAMRNRFTRFRSREPKTGEVYRWRAALGYDAAHAVCGVLALCGARSAGWMTSGEGQRRCTRCKSIVTAAPVTIVREN